MNRQTATELQNLVESMRVNQLHIANLLHVASSCGEDQLESVIASARHYHDADFEVWCKIEAIAKAEDASIETGDAKPAEAPTPDAVVMKLGAISLLNEKAAQAVREKAQDILTTNDHLIEQNDTITIALDAGESDYLALSNRMATIVDCQRRYMTDIANLAEELISSKRSES